MNKLRFSPIVEACDQGTMGNVGEVLADEMRLEAEPERVGKSLLLKSDKLELR